MEKFKISFSKLKMADRCRFTPVLALMRDEEGNNLFKANYNENTSKRLWRGIYFEERVTGKRYNPRNDDHKRYLAWQEATHDDTLERLDRYAKHTASQLLLTEGNYQAGIWVEADFPHFILRGEIDYLGVVQSSKMQFPGIVDIKLTGRIPEVWDIGGKMPPIHLLQTPMYFMSLGWMLGEENGFNDLFTDAIQLYGEGREVEAIPKMQTWMEKTKLPEMTAYLITEDTLVPEPHPPHTFLVPVKVDPRGIIMLYNYIASAVADFIKLEIYYRDKDKGSALKRMIRPDIQKCEGKEAKVLMSKGRCPFAHICPFGREVIGGTAGILPISDIIEL